MSFEPQSVINGLTLITPRLLRHIEAQYDQGVADALALDVRTSNTEIRVESRIDEPSPTNEGRIYFDLLTNKTYGYDGTEWRELGE